MRWKSLIPGCLLALLPAPFAPAAFAAQAEPPSARVEAPAPVVEARPALWVVKDDDTTIYLFGTIHLLEPRVRWFEGPVRQAFDEAQEVVLEVAEPNDEDAQARLMTRALDLESPPLTARLSSEAAAAYVAALESYGVAPLLFDRVKPWFAALTLAVLPLRRYGYDPDSGADHVIKLEGQARGKTLIGLETADEQIGFFEDLPEPLQLQLLSETLDELPTVPRTIRRMIDAWAKGDPESLAGLLNESVATSPELEKRLLTDRNARWADWIKARLDRPGTVLVAVGAGHLAGKGSVQEMLGERGVATSLVERTD